MKRTQPVPYSADVRPGDTARAMTTITPLLVPNEREPVAVEFAGHCPRCGDPFSAREWLVTVAGGIRLNDLQREALVRSMREAGIDFASGDLSFDLTCDCDGAHPNRPKDTRGCGSRFRVRVTWP